LREVRRRDPRRRRAHSPKAAPRWSDEPERCRPGSQSSLHHSTGARRQALTPRAARARNREQSLMHRRCPCDCPRCLASRAIRASSRVPKSSITMTTTRRASSRLLATSGPTSRVPRRGSDRKGGHLLGREGDDGLRPPVLHNGEVRGRQASDGLPLVVGNQGIELHVVRSRPAPAPPGRRGVGAAPSREDQELPVVRLPSCEEQPARRFDERRQVVLDGVADQRRPQAPVGVDRVVAQVDQLPPGDVCFTRRDSRSERVIGGVAYGRQVVDARVGELLIASRECPESETSTLEAARIASLRMFSLSAGLMPSRGTRSTRGGDPTAIPDRPPVPS
jgi:hypothetical protein